DGDQDADLARAHAARHQVLHAVLAAPQHLLEIGRLAATTGAARPRAVPAPLTAAATAAPWAALIIPRHANSRRFPDNLCLSRRKPQLPPGASGPAAIDELHDRPAALYDRGAPLAQRGYTLLDPSIGCPRRRVRAETV